MLCILGHFELDFWDWLQLFSCFLCIRILDFNTCVWQHPLLGWMKPQRYVYSQPRLFFLKANITLVSKASNCSYSFVELSSIAPNVLSYLLKERLKRNGLTTQLTCFKAFEGWAFCLKQIKTDSDYSSPHSLHQWYTTLFVQIGKLKILGACFRALSKSNATSSFTSHYLIGQVIEQNHFPADYLKAETSNKLFNNGKKIRHYTSYSYQKARKYKTILHIVVFFSVFFLQVPSFKKKQKKNFVENCIIIT